MAVNINQMSHWDFIYKKIKWPPYSPNLNPIENMCGEHNAVLRSKKMFGNQEFERRYIDQ